MSQAATHKCSPDKLVSTEKQQGDLKKYVLYLWKPPVAEPFSAYSLRCQQVCEEWTSIRMLSFDFSYLFTAAIFENTSTQLLQIIQNTAASILCKV